VLTERNGFYDWITAEEYLGFFAELYGHRLATAELRDRLALVGLELRPGQRIGTFSRGMRQRSGLARALIADPALLILDEPTNGLDPRGRRDIHDVLIGLAGRGVGILLCTHLLDDVDLLRHRIGVIVEGRTVAEGTIAELVRTTGHSARFRVRLAGGLPEICTTDRRITLVAGRANGASLNSTPALRPMMPGAS
jgi:ABC-2 type transport system ATP-binding protein